MFSLFEFIYFYSCNSIYIIKYVLEPKVTQNDQHLCKNHNYKTANIPLFTTTFLNHLRTLAYLFSCQRLEYNSSFAFALSSNFFALTFSTD